MLVAPRFFAADKLGDLVHPSLFFPVGGLFYLTCQVLHVLACFSALVILFTVQCASQYCCLYASALVILFTVQSASRYCCLYASYSLSYVLSMTFFFRALLLSMACEVSAVIRSFFFFCLQLRRLRWSVYRLL